MWCLRSFLLLCVTVLQGIHIGVCVTAIVYFESTSTGTNCSANTTSAVAAAASNADCATRSSLNDAWQAFSFIDGICVLLSSVNNCAPSGFTSSIFTKKRVELFTPGVPLFGYNTTVGTRSFWVFQQRQTGLVSFARSWTDYERGFGDATDFWSGLISIQAFIGTSGARTLRIEMTSFDGVFYVSEWSGFTVEDASTNYTMNYASYDTGSSNTSSSCDTLYHHKHMMFSTFDRDNDRAPFSCSRTQGSGGFWFNNCLYLNPNGLYSATNQSGNQVYMSSMCAGNYKTLRAMRMMLLV